MTKRTKKDRADEPLVADAVDFYRCKCCGQLNLVLYQNDKPVAFAQFGVDKMAEDFVMRAVDTIAVRQ